MPKRFFTSVAVLSALTLVAGQALAAAGSPPRHDRTEVVEQASQQDYAVVTFSDPAAASYTGGVKGLAPTKPERGERLNPNSRAVRDYVAHLRGVHGDYGRWLANNAPQAEIVRDFTLVSNAVAVRLNGEDHRSLGNAHGVRSVEFSGLYRPTMNVSTGLIGADALWGSLGGQADAGGGIDVGVIDTGIDDTHRFFACKDEIPHKVYASGAAFDPSNTIVFDHGTHVAGTVAGCVLELTDGPVQDTVSGVAPGASLHDYNVFPGFGGGFIAFGGSAFSHDIIAALEDTVADGMDVVNMSLGGSVQGPNDSLAEAVDATVDAGLVVAVAAGNSGPGDATVESPGSAPNALTAGASTNPHFAGIPVSYTSDTGGSDSVGAALGDFENFGVLTDVAYTVTSPTNGCSAISTDLTDKVALIGRGVCSFTTKVRNAEDAGAIGVLVANNVAGDPVAMGHDGTAFPTIPAAMVGKDDGEAMKPSGTVSIDGTVVSEFLTDNADIIAGFSSRGPTPFTALIKPDLTAPGVNVYSSVFDDGFAFFQGTSMATPHLAGAAALLLASHPDWSPDDVKSAMVNTAARVVTDHVDGEVDPGVLARGGGRLDLPRADAIPVTSSPASASFGLFEGNAAVTGSIDLALRDVAGVGSCAVAVLEDDPGDPDIVSAPESVAFSGSLATLTLTLDGGRSDTTPSGDYSGDVQLTCGGEDLLVPWWLRVERKGKP